MLDSGAKLSIFTAVIGHRFNRLLVWLPESDKILFTYESHHVREQCRRQPHCPQDATSWSLLAARSVVPVTPGHVWAITYEP